MKKEETIERYGEAEYERRLEQNRAYYEEHQEEMQERAKKWCEAHPEKTQERAKKWCEAHPEEVIANNREEVKRGKKKIMEDMKGVSHALDKSDGENRTIQK